MVNQTLAIHAFYDVTETCDLLDEPSLNLHSLNSPARLLQDAELAKDVKFFKKPIDSDEVIVQT
jgi:hypothetical protein